MNKPTMDTRVRRLKRVEWETRRWRQVGSVVLVGIAVLVLMGQATLTKVTTVVNAEKFILRDSSGKTRASLSVGPDGKVALALADKDGKIRAGLGVTSDGSPGLALADKDGTRRAGLGVGVDGTVRLDLTDKDGKPRAELAVLDYGSPVLLLRNNDGIPRALIGFMADRSPTITLTDKDGKPRAELAVSDDGLPHLAILDKDEKGSAWLTVSDDGSPALTLRDKVGNTRSLQVASLSREAEQGGKELERVRKEKLRAEAEAKAVNRDVAQAKLQLIDYNRNCRSLGRISSKSKSRSRQPFAERRQTRTARMRLDRKGPWTS